MSTALSPILKPIVNSPDLRHLIDELEDVWQKEQQRRCDFYNWITPSIKAEFIEGEVVMHSPVIKKHNVVSKYLLKILDTYVEINDLGFVGIEKIMTRFTRNDYEPDLCFFKKEKSDLFTDTQTIFPVPDFIVEITSKSTVDRDRGVKFQDYCLHKVEEYWIIDPDLEEVEQYFLDDDEYILNAKLRKGDIQCKVLNGLSFPVKAIFDRAANIRAVQTI